MNEDSPNTLSESVCAFFRHGGDRAKQEKVLDRTNADVRPQLMEVIHHFEWLQPWFEPDEKVAAKLVRDSFESRFPDLNAEAMKALVQSATNKRT